MIACLPFPKEGLRFTGLIKITIKSDKSPFSNQRVLVLQFNKIDSLLPFIDGSLGL